MDVVLYIIFFVIFFWIATILRKNALLFELILFNKNYVVFGIEPVVIGT